MSVQTERNTVTLPEGSFNTTPLTLMADYNATPNLSWAHLAQYDNESRVAGLQSRFRWILQPGNDLFLIINRSWRRTLDESRFEPLFDRVSASSSTPFVSDRSAQ